MRVRSRKPGQFAESLRKSWRRKLLAPYYYLYPFASLWYLFYVVSYLVSIYIFDYTEVGEEYMSYLFLLPVVFVWQRLERTAVKEMARVGYDMIYRYDIWYMVEFGSENGVISNLLSKVFPGSGGNIDNPISFLKRLWAFSSASYTEALGEHYKSYAALDAAEHPNWPSDVWLIMRQVWNIRERAKNGILVAFRLYYFVVFAALLWELDPNTAKIPSLHALAFIAYPICLEIGAIVLGNRISKMAFAAGYYKMLTDNWPWENAGE